MHHSSSYHRVPSRLVTNHFRDLVLKNRGKNIYITKNFLLNTLKIFWQFFESNICRGKSANRTVPNPVAFSVRILHREPYRTKKRAVFRFLQKAQTISYQKTSIFTCNKTGNGLYLGSVKFAIKIENGKLFCFCNGTLRVFYLPKNGKQSYFCYGAVRGYKNWTMVI